MSLWRYVFLFRRKQKYFIALHFWEKITIFFPNFGSQKMYLNRKNLLTEVSKILTMAVSTVSNEIDENLQYKNCYFFSVAWGRLWNLVLLAQFRHTAIMTRLELCIYIVRFRKNYPSTHSHLYKRFVGLISFIKITVPRKWSTR